LKAVDRAQLFWQRMVELYTDKWTSKNGLMPSNLWIEALNSLSNDDIKSGLGLCKDRIFQGNEWPVDLSGFLALVYGTDKTEISKAFQRFQNGKEKPRNDIEFNVKREVGYMCKQLTYEKSENLYIKTYLKFLEMQRRGEPMPSKDQLLITATATITDRDIEIQNRAQAMLNGERRPTVLEQRLQKVMIDKRERDRNNQQAKSAKAVSDGLFRGKHSDENFKPK